MAADIILLAYKLFSYGCEGELRIPHHTIISTHARILYDILWGHPADSDGNDDSRAPGLDGISWSSDVDLHSLGVDI